MKDYKLSVPVMNHNVDDYNREKTLNELKRCGAERVFLALDPFSGNVTIQDKQFEELKINTDYFKSNGFEVGVWIDSCFVTDNNSILKRVDRDGTIMRTGCPADEELLELAEKYMTEFSKIGVDIIMFDDNFHFGGRRACYCENHRKLFAKMFGDEYEFDEVSKRAFIDENSEETKMMLSVSSESLKNYARRMRKAVDSINPDIRMSICANVGNYGQDGVSVEEICKIFAGNTKPFVRTIGSPYWDYYPDWPNRLSFAVEAEREQAEMLKNSGIEMMSEGDVFPRPRTYTPASTLECFDMMMIANGRHNGILKYMLDYNAPADYETGYIDLHNKNKKLRDEIYDNFAGKKSIGVRMYGIKDRLCQLGSFFSQLSIPTTYEGEGTVGAAFGETAGHISEKVLENGIITDAVGAMCLMKKGIDVGLKSKPEKIKVNTEIFEDRVYYRTYTDAECFYKLDVCENTCVDSYYMAHERRYWDEAENMEKIPAAYFYENENKQRFFVLAMDVDSALKDVLKECFRTYKKAEQVMRACEWAGRKELPVKCYKYPDLYVMCKEDEEAVSVGIWNLSRDRIDNPKLYINKDYSEIKCINCKGEINGNEISLSVLYPYEFSGFTLKK